MIKLVEGWTERIRYTLLSDGVAQSLVGMTIALKLYTRTGLSVSLTGTGGVINAAGGVVYYDPSPLELLSANSPYIARWEVTDSGGKKAYYPNGEPELWVVAKP